MNHRHGIAMGVLAGVLAAAPGTVSAEEADARELYYQRADPELEEKDAWLGVRTSVLLTSRDRRRARMRVREVGDETGFRTGDRFRLAVQANVAGYLYVLVKDSEGSIELLFPYEQDRETNTVKPFRTRQVPERDWFRFDDREGVERVYLFLSREPIRELEWAAGEDERFRDRDIDRLLEDAGDNPWKLFDEPDREGKTLRTYYVERPQRRSSYLVRAFNLEHR